MEVAVVVERPAKQGIGTMRAIPERRLSQSGDFTNYWETGRLAKVVGEMAIFRQS